jgi:hypothetical protein
MNTFGQFLALRLYLWPCFRRSGVAPGAPCGVSPRRSVTPESVTMLRPIAAADVVVAVVADESAGMFAEGWRRAVRRRGRPLGA